jgi:hypothetical protein
MKRRNPSFEMWTPDKRSVARFWSNDGSRWDVGIYGDGGNSQRLQSKRGVTRSYAEKWARGMLAKRMKMIAARNPNVVGERWEYAYRGKKKGVWRMLFAVSTIVRDNGATVTFADGRTVPNEALVRPVGPRNAGNPKRGGMLFRTKASARKYAREHGLKGYSIRKVKRA